MMLYALLLDFVGDGVQCTHVPPCSDATGVTHPRQEKLNGVLMNLVPNPVGLNDFSKLITFDVSLRANDYSTTEFLAFLVSDISS